MHSMKKKFDEELYYNLFVVLVLFFTFINFKNYGSVIFPLGASILLFYLFIKGKIDVNLELVFIVSAVLFFTSSYELIKSQYVQISTFKLLHHILTPAIAVLFGYFVLIRDFSGKKNVTRLCFFLVVIIFSFFIYGTINVIIELASGKKLLANINSRKVYDIWLKVGLAATIQNAKFFLSISFIPMILFGKFKRKYIKFIMSMFILFSLYCAMIMGSRTFLIGIVFVTIICWFLYNVMGLKINNKKLIFTLLAVGIIFAMLFFINAFGIQDKLMNSFLFQRLFSGSSTSILEDPRLKMWISVLGNLFNYPFGGYLPVTELNFAHNLWLDIAFATGIIPFILFLLLTVYSLFGFTKLIKMKIGRNIKMFLLAFVLSLLFLYLMEPIIEGFYTHYLIFYFLIGSCSWDIFKCISKKNSIINRFEK